jgi:hypothetical protein
MVQDQHGMLLEGCARGWISGIVGYDIGQRYTAQFGGKSRAQRDDIHRPFLQIFFAKSCSLTNA